MVREHALVATLLDVMVLAKVEAIQAEEVYEDLHAYFSRYVRRGPLDVRQAGRLLVEAEELSQDFSLDKLSTSSLLNAESLQIFHSVDNQLSFALSALQALERLPTDETPMHRVFHRVLHFAEGVSLLTQAWGNKKHSLPKRWAQ